MDEMRLLFFVILLLFASTLLCKAQTIDRKLMKENTESLFADKMYGNRGKAKWFAQKYPLKDSVLSVRSELLCVGQSYTTLYDKVLAWVKNTKRVNNFSIIKEYRKDGYLEINCALKNICHRSVGNVKYEVSMLPVIRYYFINGKIVINYRIKEYYVKRIFDDSSPSLTEAQNKNRRKVRIMTWQIADCFPYKTKSQHPKITSTRALVTSFNVMLEITQLTGEATGVRKKRPKPDTFF